MEEKQKVKEKRSERNSRAPVNHHYKDNVFRKLFSEAGELLSLYNALNGTHYTDESALNIVTLESAVYMSMKNDVAFVFDAQLMLYEHQSTRNLNMPLRDLFYISAEYQKLVPTEKLYSKQVSLPTPRFVVFYNGTDPQAERQTLKLSDAFEKQVEEPELELKVLVLNINDGYNEDIKEQCRTLWQYCQFVQKIRTYAKEMDSIEETVEQAVKECIAEGILKEFLTANRAEVIGMSIFEYNEELTMKQIRMDEYEEGRKDGRASGLKDGRTSGKAEMLLELLAYKGTLPESVREAINNQKDEETLKRWFSIALRSDTVEAFCREAGL